MEGRVAVITGNLEKNWLEGTTCLNVSSNTFPLRDTLNQARKIGIAASSLRESAYTLKPPVPGSSPGTGFPEN